MCGLALCIGKGHEEKTRTMIDQMAHRGIRSNVIDCKGYSLGHVRLPIQGLSEEFDQPYSSIPEYYTCFVGEIFNHKEFLPNSKSDIPLVDFLLTGFHLLDGFWSIVYADPKQITVYTDHLAKKPLYILREKQTLAICSEILPLLSIAEEWDWDHHNLSTTAKWGYSAQPNTPFDIISKIPPNTRMTIDPITCEMKFLPYLSFPARPKQNLRLAIETAVKNRLVSDIPVSLLLSGGLDSTIVYQLVRQFTDEITVFHIDNGEEEYLNYLDLSGIPIRKISLDTPSEPNTAMFEFILTPALLSNQTPVDLGSMIQQYMIGKAIKKEGLSVAISGDGADELFGGYRRINTYDSQYSDIFDELVYYHLPRLDRQMMAHTVELRCPFLAPDVINNALALPYSQRINKNTLKEVFSDIVPKPIIDRAKEPLKIANIRRDKMAWRLSLISSFKCIIGELYEHTRCIRQGNPD